MKIQKNLLVGLFLVCCPLFLFGQLKHEVKIVPLDLFSTFTPSYELVIKKKIGVEIEMSFDSRDAVLPAVDCISTSPGQFRPARSEEVDRRRFSPSISGKYYFLFTDYGNGFYIGPHLKSIFNTYLDEAYQERYLRKFNAPPPYWGSEGFQTFAFGLNGGFKWLIKEHFIVESSFLLTRFYAKEADGKFDAKGSDLDIEIRVGYRF